MAFMEQIVRPFQKPEIINDKKTRVTRVTSLVKEKAILVWGSPGDAPETKQVGAKIIVKGDGVKKAFTEVSRKTTDIRIQNPNDPSQYVIAQRPDEVTFRRPKPFSDNRTGQPTNVPPGNQKSTLGNFTGPGSGIALGSGSPTEESVFNDGSTGTTIIKNTTPTTVPNSVNGNTNATSTTTAGAVTTSPGKLTETSKYILLWKGEGTPGV